MKKEKEKQYDEVDKYKMRRKERIPKILKIIQEEWEKNSDLRLGQLLINNFKYPIGDIFNIPDSVFGINEWSESKERGEKENGTKHKK